MQTSLREHKCSLWDLVASIRMIGDVKYLQQGRPSSKNYTLIASAMRMGMEYETYLIEGEMQGDYMPARRFIWLHADLFRQRSRAISKTLENGLHILHKRSLIALLPIIQRGNGVASDTRQPYTRTKVIGTYEITLLHISQAGV